MHDNNFLYHYGEISKKAGTLSEKGAGLNSVEHVHQLHAVLMETLASNQLSSSVWKPLGVALSGSTSAL